jgi:hypothetical protein
MASFYAATSTSDSSDSDAPSFFDAHHRQLSFQPGEEPPVVDFSFQNLDVESLTVCLSEQWLLVSSSRSNTGEDGEREARRTACFSNKNTSVTTMKLEGNSLDSVPPIVTQFDALRRLDLSSNRVSVLSDKVWQQFST